MSARFASITAGLLARKGEARPWSAGMSQAMPPAMPSEIEPEKVALVWRTEPAPPPPGKARSCSVRMSAQDYERLGILAVKMSTTRQQLMQRALADMLAARAQHLSCACLGSCDKGCS